MNIALFVANRVGYEVAKFLGESKEPVACLVLDAKEDDERKKRIIEGSGIVDEKILYSDQLLADRTLSELREMKLDLIILAWWPYLIKSSLIGIPRLGCLNFHPSFLPFNRGRHYNFWTIVEDVPFGVTIHWVDEGIDSGDIAFQAVIEKSWEDTGETLYDKAQKEIVRLFKEKFAQIKEGRIPRIAQGHDKGSFHWAKELEPASMVNLERQYRARDLLNILRARTFPPHPGAWFVEDGSRYEVEIKIKRVSDE